MKFLKGCLTATFALAACTALSNDVITLKSGKTIRGEVLEYKDGLIRIKRQKGVIGGKNIDSIKEIQFERKSEKSQSKKSRGSGRTDRDRNKEKLPKKSMMPRKSNSESKSFWGSFEDVDTSEKQANNSSAARSSSNKKRSDVIVKFSGSGGKNTRPFTLPDGCEIQWVAKDAWVFVVYLCDEDGRTVGVPVNHQGGGSGKSYLAKGGKYYLQVNTAGEEEGNWHIRIIDAN